MPFPDERVRLRGAGTSARARIGSRGCERVGIDVASTVLKLSFNGESRSGSHAKLLEGHAGGRHWLGCCLDLSWGRLSCSRA